MNIGVYIGNSLPNPEVGGGFTFEENIIQGILETNSDHKFFFLISGRENSSDSQFDPKIKRIYLKEPITKKVKAATKLLPNRLKSISGLKTDEQQSAINRAIKQNQIEIVWFITPQYIPVNAPFIFTVWDLCHKTHPFFPEVSTTGWTWEAREALFATAIPKSTYVMIGTEVGKNEITHFYQAPAEKVIVNPFPAPGFARNAPKPDKNILKELHLPDNFIFYPAQFWPHKNHINLLRALKQLREKHKVDLSLVLTGSDQGNKGYIDQQIKKLGLEESVFSLGFVSRQVLVELYRNALALTFLPLMGPDNLPPLEAFALGCPVIASNIPGGFEQLGDAALLVNPTDETKISEAILSLHHSPDLRQKLINRGKERIKDKTSTNYVNNVLTAIDRFQPYRCCWSA